MPTSGETEAPYIPRYNILFQEGQVLNPPPFSRPMTANQFVGFDCTPPPRPSSPSPTPTPTPTPTSPTPTPETPILIDTDLDDLEEIKSVRRFGLFIQIGAAILIVGLFATVIAVAFAFSPKTPVTSNETTMADTTQSTTMTDTTQSTTTTTTDTTTTATCATGYSRAPSGGCYNLQIDFNNCGSFGYVCSSNYTSCSAGVCSGAPAVQLIGAVAVSGWGGQFSVDDAYVTVNFPLNLTLYNYSTPNASVTSNGVVCLGGCSWAYSNGNLPDGQFAGPTAFGYWDDLMIYAGTSQTVYYNVDGTAPNRTTTFEFYESHYGASTQYYHFQILFYENLPNIVKYIYFQISDSGASATVGTQASSSGPSMTYSVNQPSSIINNMILVFNTNTGTFTG